MPKRLGVRFSGLFENSAFCLRIRGEADDFRRIMCFFRFFLCFFSHKVEGLNLLLGLFFEFKKVEALVVNDYQVW